MVNMLLVQLSSGEDLVCLSELLKSRDCSRVRPIHWFTHYFVFLVNNTYFILLL